MARTKDGRQVWAAYPSSDAQTPDLLRRLSRSGTIVAVDQQSSKPAKQIVVQFLLPILILVCLFGFFMRVGQDSMAGGFSAFSKIGGKRRKGKGLARTTFANVAGAGEAVTELREIRDYLADPTKYDVTGRSRSARSAARRPARDRQDAAGARDRRRGRGGVLLAVRAPSSSSRWSGWARRAFATCSRRRARPRRRSSSSTSSTPPGGGAAPASARATTSASRRSTRSSWRWTASTPRAASS